MFCKKSIQTIQLFAGAVVIIGSMQLANADGDGCSQSIHRWAAQSATDVWLHTGCNVGTPCGSGDQCKAHDPGGGYSICTCGTYGTVNSSKCQKGFKADDPPANVNVDGVPKVKGTEACVQWTCTIPCDKEWDDVSGTPTAQKSLRCVCPP